MKEVYITIGIPGSGKSTWSNLHFKPQHIVSSDSVRQMLYGTEDVQGGVFTWDAIYSIARAKIDYHEKIVIDSTAAIRRDRLSVLRIARYSSLLPIKVIAVVFPVDPETANKRQELRLRKVPLSVLKRHYDGIRNLTEESLLEEGFDEVLFVN